MDCCTTEKGCHTFLGLIAFVIGAVILLQKFDIIPSETWSYVWPIILIVAGLKMMVGCCASSCGSSCETTCCETECKPCPPCEPCEKPKKKAPAKKKPTAKKKTAKK
jgi:hypothetical protein